MKRKLVYIIIFILIFLTACASEKYLRTDSAKGTDLAGAYNLILYGRRHSDDLETIAILDVSDDQYIFEPFAPAFDFSIVKNVPAKEALEKAIKFVSWHPDFWISQLSRIRDPENRTIGYEVRPLYFPLDYGISDVMDVDYWLKPDGTVKVTIKLKPQIERMLYEGGGNAESGGK